MSIVEAERLSKHFPGRASLFGGRSAAPCAPWTDFFAIEPGQTLGVVGEIRLRQNHHGQTRAGARAAVGGRHPLRGKGFALTRHRRSPTLPPPVQAVFQDPYASLNPRMRVGAIIRRTAHHQRTAARKQSPHARARAVGPGRTGGPLGRPLSRTSSPAASASAIAIARALSLSPKLIVLDEPVSALDVSIRAQILNLLRDLQAQLGSAYLFIAHDLAAVAHMEPRHPRHVSRPHRRVRRDAHAGGGAKASLYQSLVLGGAALAARRAARRNRADRRGAEPAAAAPWVPFSSSLPARDAALSRASPS